MKERIHIYYTNDLHSHFENWPKATGFLKKKKLDADNFKEFSLIVDIGDHMDRVNPLTDATLGQVNVSLLNEAGYDVVTLGNNEGITLSHDELYHLYDDASFDVVCSNLVNTEGENPSWLKPYEIRTAPSGLRIGLFGLTARFNPYYNLLGWDAEEVAATVEQTLQELKGKADIIVLLSHLGINEDRSIATQFPDIDLIIGGHTHHLLKTGEMVHDTLLTAAGKKVTHAGEVTLLWDHEQDKLIGKEAYAIDITHLEPDPETTRHLREWQEDADKWLAEPVVEVKQPLHVDWYQETPIIRAMTNELMAWTNADGAMLNAGLLIRSLDTGIITLKDVHAICPHPINPVVVELTADELRETARASLTQSFMDKELKGFGFRGKLLGRMVFAGIEMETEQHRDGQVYVKRMSLNGNPLEKDRGYRIATGDLFTFGNLLPPVARSPFKKLYLPEFMRDVLTETLQNMK